MTAYKAILGIVALMVFLLGGTVDTLLGTFPIGFICAIFVIVLVSFLVTKLEER